MSNAIKEYLQHDNDKIERLIADYPVLCPIDAVAEFLGVDPESVRSAIESGVFGMSWKKSGKLNRAFRVPTPQFVRWYLQVNS